MSWVTSHDAGHHLDLSPLHKPNQGFHPSQFGYGTEAYAERTIGHDNQSRWWPSMPALTPSFGGADTAMPHVRGVTAMMLHLASAASIALSVPAYQGIQSDAR